MLENVREFLVQSKADIFNNRLTNQPPPILTDLIRSCSELEAILYLHEHGTEEDWKQRARTFLAARWEYTANQFFCPTLNTEYRLNSICVELARAIDPAQYLHLLMPTVVIEDIYGTALTDLSIGQFIIADNKTQFIAIDSLVTTAAARFIESERELFITTTPEGEQRPLSEAENARLGGIGQRISAHLATINQRNLVRVNLYDQLIQLRNGLRAGDAHHFGEEYNAGSQANVAIAAFHAFFSNLTPDEQDEIRNVRENSGCTLGLVFDRIFRPARMPNSNSWTSTNYCIGILGRELEAIINCNREYLGGFTEAQTNIVRHIVVDVRAAIAQERLMHPALSTNSYSDPYTFLIRSAKQHITNSLSRSPHTLSTKSTLAFIDLLELLKTIYQSYSATSDCREEAACCSTLLLATSLEAFRFQYYSFNTQSLVTAEIVMRLSLITEQARRLADRHTTANSDSLFKIADEWNAYKKQHGMAISNLPTTHPQTIRTYQGAYPPDRQTSLSTPEIDASKLRDTQELVLIRAIKHFLESSSNRINQKRFNKEPKLEYVTQLLNAIIALEGALPTFSVTVKEAYLQEILTRTAILCACNGGALNVGHPKSLTEWQRFLSEHRSMIATIMLPELLQPHATSISAYEHYIVNGGREQSNFDSSAIRALKDAQRIETGNAHYSEDENLTQPPSKTQSTLVPQGLFSKKHLAKKAGYGLIWGSSFCLSAASGVTIAQMILPSKFLSLGYSAITNSAIEDSDTQSLFALCALVISIISGLVIATLLANEAIYDGNGSSTRPRA